MTISPPYQSPQNATQNFELPTVRVCISAANKQVDLALPSTIPIGMFIADLIDLLTGSTENLHDDHLPTVHEWSLAALGVTPFSFDANLSQYGVLDGDILFLSKSENPSSAPLFDDVITAVAEICLHEFSQYGPLNSKILGYAASLVASILFAATLIVTTFSPVHTWWPAVCGSATALILFLAAVLVKNIFSDSLTAQVLSLCSIPVAAVSGYTILPQHSFIAAVTSGAAVGFVWTMTAYRYLQIGTTCHTAAAVILGMTCAAGIYLMYVSESVGPPAVAIGIIFLSLAPRISVLSARVPLPPVPTAGDPLDPGNENLHPNIEGIGAIGAIALPAVTALTERSQLANRYLTGYTIGSGFIIFIGTAVTLISNNDWRSWVFGTLAMFVTLLRARIFSDQIARCALAICGGFIGTALIVILISRKELFIATGSALGLMLCGFGFGVIAPRLTYSPVQRRAVELAEYTAIAALFPLGLWLINLYATVRSLG